METNLKSLSILVMAATLFIPHGAHADGCPAAYSGASPEFHSGNFERLPDLPGCFNPAGGAIFRGGQPSLPAGLQVLQQRGVTADIDLMDHGDRTDGREEEDWAASHGMTYVNIPFKSGWTSPPSTIRIRVRRPGSTQAEVRDVSPAVALWATVRYAREVSLGGRNVYVHCRHGQYRTGMFVRLLRSCDGAAEAENRCFGGHQDERPLWQIFTEASALEASLAPDPGSSPVVATLNWLEGPTNEGGCS